MVRWQSKHDTWQECRQRRQSKSGGQNSGELNDNTPPKEEAAQNNGGANNVNTPTQSATATGVGEVIACIDGWI